jgi:hypothetical protein
MLYVFRVVLRVRGRGRVTVARHGRRGMERGALGAGAQGHDRAGCADGGGSNRGGRGGLRASHTDTTTA